MKNAPVKTVSQLRSNCPENVFVSKPNLKNTSEEVLAPPSVHLFGGSRRSCLEDALAAFTELASTGDGFAFLEGGGALGTAAGESTSDMHFRQIFRQIEMAPKSNSENNFD